MEWFLIYLFVAIEKFAAALALGWGVFWLGALITVAVFFIAACRSDTDYPKNRTFEYFWKEDYFSKGSRRIAKLMMVFGFIFGTIGHFLPSQKELAIIVGSGVTYNVLTSDPAKALGNKALILLNKKIDSALESEDNNDQAQ
jgi:hypothetical protein